MVVSKGFKYGMFVAMRIGEESSSKKLGAGSFCVI